MTPCPDVDENHPLTIICLIPSMCPSLGLCNKFRTLTLARFLGYVARDVRTTPSSSSYTIWISFIGFHNDGGHDNQVIGTVTYMINSEIARSVKHCADSKITKI
jgi:hypothetical protein